MGLVPVASLLSRRGPRPGSVHNERPMLVSLPNAPPPAMNTRAHTHTCKRASTHGDLAVSSFPLGPSTSKDAWNGPGRWHACACMCLLVHPGMHPGVGAGNAGYAAGQDQPNRILSHAHVLPITSFQLPTSLRCYKGTCVHTRTHTHTSEETRSPSPKHQAQSTRAGSLLTLVSTNSACARRKVEHSLRVRGPVESLGGGGGGRWRKEEGRANPAQHLAAHRTQWATHTHLVIVKGTRTNR